MLELCRPLYRCSLCQRESVFAYAADGTVKLTLQARCPNCKRVTHAAVSAECLFADRPYQAPEEDRAAAVDA
jgi:DNA-directed RNA polymerase subunit RPC12/RpoP